MASEKSPREQMLDRIRSWNGVSSRQKAGVTEVVVSGRVIARFPTDDTFDVALCGSLRRQVEEEPEFIPEGVWPIDQNARLLMDLNQPEAMEEAFRHLLNAYLASASAGGHDWYIRDAARESDPKGVEALAVIENYRELIRERGYSVYPEEARSLV